MTTTLCGECGGRLANHRCVDCGTNHESLHQWANRQIVEYRFTYPGCRADFDEADDRFSCKPPKDLKSKLRTKVSA